MTAARRFPWRFDVSAALDVPGAHAIAVDAIVPRDAGAAARRPVLCCLPGGSLSRRYHDLELDGDRSYSFAEFMAARGFASLLFDHLGTGESSRPDGPAALDPDRIAAANQAALARALARLRAGGAEPGLPPLAAPATIGVGHSMGSMVAQRFAIDHPERVRGLMLVASFAGYSDNPVTEEEPTHAQVQGVPHVSG